MVLLSDIILSTILLSPTALAADTLDATTKSDPADHSHLFVRQAVGVAGWPSGLQSDTRFELRTPLHRSQSILFQDTSAGVGGRVAVSPAFIEAGPRISLAPIDVFDIDLSASAITYWSGRFGPLPTDHLGGTLESDRALLADDTVTSTGLLLKASPTLKAKVGPVICFDAWTLRHQRLAAPPNVTANNTANAWVYEPFTDLIVAWTDTIVEHQPGLLLDLVPDNGGAWLRVGGTMIDRWSVTTRDRTLAAGALVATKPGQGAAVPTIAGMALVYAVDDDRRGGAPYLGVQAAWTLRSALRNQPTAPAVSMLQESTPSVPSVRGQS